jgi:His/Glu/Gln/Arg/opine family amino acid ABC transporter permease subunit
MATAAELRAKAKQRQILIQGVILVSTILLVLGAVSNAQYNLTRMNMTSGFAFLERGTGWDYSFSLIERDISDHYSYTLFVGFLNTVFVGFICIITTTFFGFIIGTLRDARHPALSLAANVYVQIFRNIPLILQVIFLYALLIHLGGPRQAISIADVAFISGRGVMLPSLNVSAGIAVGMLAASVALAVALVMSKVKLWRGVGAWIFGSVVLALIAAFIFKPSGESVFSIPVLQGLRFQGGINMPIELLAMILSITLYGSAYIAEIVRGGLSQVPKGLVEAGQALGLTHMAIWSRIKVPMALRSIIPPLGNQWIFMMKATTIGIAIGFSDLFYITVTSISQSGQTLELIMILMLIFLAINYSIALFTNWLNTRMKLKEH